MLFALFVDIHDNSEISSDADLETSTPVRTTTLPSTNYILFCFVEIGCRPKQLCMQKA
jgi:hypothetical protein